MDTRIRLVAAAEKLFGEHGLNGVTLKEITKEAGQKNESALHYHFGGKPKLVEAILRARVAVIDKRRVVLVDQLEREGRQDEPREIIWAAIEPLAGLLGSEEGARFVRFLAQAVGDPEVDMAAIAFDSQYDGIRRIGSMLDRTLEALPLEISRLRRRLLIEMLVLALASWSRRRPVDDHAGRMLFLDNLIDASVGFLTAPVSSDTLLSLKVAQQTSDSTTSAFQVKTGAASSS
ncbi:MAG: helix-turn-helix domain containing protein [Parvibaculaceae bacterium]|nr:helix-turn-helix domain containing protein [Parvibaculaceae bacterium]